MSLIDLVARTASRDELVELLRGTEEQRQRLAEALKPFAKAHDEWSGGNAREYFADAVGPGDYRIAAIALANTQVSDAKRLLD